MDIDINKNNLTAIEKIEQELSYYTSSEKNDWLAVYRLMERVKLGELYKERDLNSFNAWVNFTAQLLGVGSSTLWRKYKAGRAMQEYVVRTGCDIDNKALLSVSPDTIACIETLAGRDSNKMDFLITKAIDGKVSRREIRLALKEKRRSSPNSIPTSRHNRIKASDRTEESRITASDIVLELGGWQWLEGLIESPIRTTNPIKTYLYSLQTELGVATGTSAHKRRFDGLILENLTLNNNDNDGINLHGIEIKVNKYDLQNDTKMQEYTDFCDFFYIAIPNDKEMIKIARDIKLPEWGILIYSEIETDQKIKILDKPKRLKAIFKDKTLENILLRTLGKKQGDFS